MSMWSAKKCGWILAPSLLVYAFGIWLTGSLIGIEPHVPVHLDPTGQRLLPVGRQRALPAGHPIALAWRDETGSHRLPVQLDAELRASQPLAAPREVELVLLWPERSLWYHLGRELSW